MTSASFSSYSEHLIDWISRQRTLRPPDQLDSKTWKKNRTNCVLRRPVLKFFPSTGCRSPGFSKISSFPLSFSVGLPLEFFIFVVVVVKELELKGEEGWSRRSSQLPSRRVCTHNRQHVLLYPSLHKLCKHIHFWKAKIEQNCRTTNLSAAENPIVFFFLEPRHSSFFLEASKFW